VEEESDAEAVESAAQEGREGEEVVVMDPDVVVLGVEDLDDALVAMAAADRSSFLYPRHHR
jgi:predicted RecB family endonuclease